MVYVHLERSLCSYGVKRMGSATVFTKVTRVCEIVPISIAVDMETGHCLTLGICQTDQDPINFDPKILLLYSYISLYKNLSLEAVLPF